MSFAVQAVHDYNLFELEGNAVHDFIDDAEDIFNGTDSALISTFIGQDQEDPRFDNSFQHNGAKDTNDFPDWNFTKTNVSPDKDEIINAFAAAYRNAAGDLIFYFGQDRFDSNGSAEVAFWFLRNPINLVDDDNDGLADRIDGVHDDQDVLVTFDYQGNKTKRADAHLWDGGALTSLFSLSGDDADCDTAPIPHAPDPDICATTNRGGDNTSVPWPYVNKGVGGGTTLVANYPKDGLYFEGGINMTAAGLDGICFSRMMAESRSSFSLNSKNKDIALAAFELCAVKVTKTGDTLSKVGDDADYTILVENTGVVRLYKQSITDDLLGNLTDGLNPLITGSDCGDFLEPMGMAGDSCTITATRTVMVGDPDSLDNTVTVIYDSQADLLGDEASSSDDHSVNLFAPAVIVVKSGDTLSKVGDSVDYSITVTNDSSADTPDLVNGTISDTLLGNLLDGANPYVTSSDCSATLATGTNCTITASRTVLAGDADPLPNTVTVHYNPDGFPNDITDSDGHSVNLFQPAVSVVKSGDTLSKVGDSVDYSITVTNDSSADTPNLVNGSISDTLLGNLLDGANPYVTSSDCGTTLPTSSSCTIAASRTVQAGDADPLPNTVSVSYNPDGFPNIISNSDDHSVNLFQPSVLVTKECREETFQNGIITAGERAEWVLTVENTGSADSPNLVLDSANDSFFGAVAGFSATLAPGAKETVVIDYTPTLADVGTISNIFTVHYHPAGFPNDITDDQSHDCPIAAPGPAVIVWEKVSIGGVDTYNYDTTNDAQGGGLPPLVPLTTVVSNGSNTDANSPFTTTPNDGVSGFATTSPNFSVTTVFGTDLTYTIEEQDPVGSDFTSVECQKEQSDGSFAQIIYSEASRLVSLNVGEDDVVYCRYINTFPVLEQGCTPGYWKVPQHHDSWDATGYTTGQALNSVFSFPGGGPVAALGSDSMLDALNYQGGNGAVGGAQILLRAAVAAVLNAAHPDIGYPLAEQDVIDDVSAALQSGDRATMLALATQLDDANNGVLINNEGTHDCPLN